MASLGPRVLVAIALAVLGFCIGLLGRHTAAAIGVLLGYLFVWFVRNAVLIEARLGPAAHPLDPGGQPLAPWSASGTTY